MQNRIKELRNLRSLKQAELAEVIGVAANTLSYWEQGKFEPSSKDWATMANYFNVTVDYIMGYSNVNNNASETELPEGFRFALSGDYRALDENDRDELKRMADRMLELKMLRNLRSKGNADENDKL